MAHRPLKQPTLLPQWPRQVQRLLDSQEPKSRKHKPSSRPRQRGHWILPVLQSRWQRSRGSMTILPIHTHTHCVINLRLSNNYIETQQSFPLMVISMTEKYIEVSRKECFSLTAAKWHRHHLFCMSMWPRSDPTQEWPRALRVGSCMRKGNSGRFWHY